MTYFFTNNFLTDKYVEICGKDLRTKDLNMLSEQGKKEFNVIPS